MWALNLCSRAWHSEIWTNITILYCFIFKFMGGLELCFGGLSPCDSQIVVRIPLVVREGLQGGTRIDLLSAFLHKKYILSCSFYYRVLLINSWIFVLATSYFPCCFLKIAIKISHSHFVHVAFVSILVFQTFDRMIFGTLTFPGTRWYVMTVRESQMVRDQKKFENHCCSVYSASWGNTYAGTILPSFENNWLK